MFVATGEPRFETLLDVTVEGAPDDWTPLSVERWTMQPGATTLTIPPLNGPQWIVADGGTLVVAVDGAERSLDANAGVVVPAGQELLVRNPGDGAISALRGVAATSFTLEAFDRAAITRQIALDTRAHEALPPGSSRVVFERLTIPAGTSLLVEPATGQDWVGVASGQLGLTLMGDAVPQGWSSGREREVAADELLPALVPGTRVSLHNIGEEPLVLLRLQVLPTAGVAGETGP